MGWILLKFQNVSIKNRILLSNIGMILIPIFVILIAAPFFFQFAETFLRMDTVTSNEYGAVNQLQWNMTMSQLTSELSKGSLEEENKKLFNHIDPLEDSGCLLLIEKNGSTAYVTQGAAADSVLGQASEMAGQEVGASDLFFCGEQGLAIAGSRIDSEAEAETWYRMVILDPAYQTVLYSEETGSLGTDLRQFLAGRMGLLVLAIVLVFALSIGFLTIMTSRGILRPLAKISQGPNDFEIEYESKNEFGRLVDDFNQMKARLKTSLEKQEALELQRKEMIAGFSHDLRTPLTSIKGYMEGLLDGIAKTPEKQQEYLQTIYTATCDLEHMVNELFTFAKLDVDKMSLNLENVTLYHFISDCCEDQRRELEQHGIEISFSSACDQMTVVSVDRSQFSRVLLNILSNSVKYKKPGQPGHVHIHMRCNDQYVLIEMEDDGIGIDEETARFMFETFYRADPARANAREGSGLGLAICKQIVNLHDGNIWATGEPGVGTTIHIALPLPEIKE
ncbi:MAG: HAMP domain-containing histidine kinase [Clostridiales bacterium]|nr:HAMP domain-containing histidine kinase [Clostridiales bacterium]